MENQDLHREHKSELASEGRITNIILTHWYDIRKDKVLPSEKDIDPNILEPILDNCFLIKTKELRTLEQHRYIYIGKNILDAYGSRVTSPKDYDDIDPLSHKNKFEEVLKYCKPIIDEGEFINKDGLLVKYRQCIVPLGEDRNNIESIFGGMRFKVFN